MLSTLLMVIVFVLAVFIMVPILAPSIGQLILLVADWRSIFYGLVLVGAINFLWLAARRPETLEATARAPLSLTHILRSAGEALSNHVTLGYTIATGFVFGAFISYLGMSQQIFQDQYDAGKLFAVYFGMLAAGIGCASISAEVASRTSFSEPNNSPSRPKKSPPSGRETRRKCVLSAASRAARRVAASSACSGVAPSIITSMMSRSCGKAVSIARSCLRQSTLGEISSAVSVVIAKRSATTASASAASTSAATIVSHGRAMLAATARGTGFIMLSARAGRTAP